MLGSNLSPNNFHTTTNCSTLLKELQQLWNDIGESYVEKDRMLLDLERECLEVYQRKVDEVANAKARLHQMVVAKEAELATLMASLGDSNLRSPTSSKNSSCSLKEQLAYITPLVDDLKIKKQERLKQFMEIKSQIEKINTEISGYSHLVNSMSLVNLEEEDLSMRKLNDYQMQLRTLQKEKSERLHKVLGYVNEVHSLCSLLGFDFGKTVNDVDPSLGGPTVEQSTNISDSTLEGLNQTIVRLKTERRLRFQKLKDIVASLSELWALMDSTREEKSTFQRISYILRCSELEISEPGALSMEQIQQASGEVERLMKLKASRMKELVIKKRAELEDVCFKTHINPDPSTAPEKSIALIDSGLVDPCELLANIEAQISKTKDEALSRREVMDRIEKWLSACDEENWLEQYNKDDNRYSAGRGAHINLKRAERARVTINKIPAMVDNLISRTLLWEKENMKLFLYDGVRLVSILDDYKVARRQKEVAKKQFRDQKKLQDLLLTEKELMYGSKPSPKKWTSFRKTNSGYGPNGNGSMTPAPRRSSVGCATPELLTPRSYSGGRNGYFKEMRRLSTGPLNFVAIAKEDTLTFSSVCSSEPESPSQG